MREPESLDPYIEVLQEVVGGGIEVGEEEVEGGKRLLISTEAKQWSFCPAQASRLTKERAAQILSSVEGIAGEWTGEKRAPLGREGDRLLLAASHVTDEAGRLLREQGVSYLDKAGNCYLSDGSLLLFVHGQKPADDRQPRATPSRLCRSRGPGRSQGAGHRTGDSKEHLGRNPDPKR